MPNFSRTILCLLLLTAQWAACASSFGFVVCERADGQTRIETACDAEQCGSSERPDADDDVSVSERGCVDVVIKAVFAKADAQRSVASFVPWTTLYWFTDARFDAPFYRHAAVESAAPPSPLSRLRTIILLT